MPGSKSWGSKSERSKHRDQRTLRTGLGHCLRGRVDRIRPPSPKRPVHQPPHQVITEPPLRRAALQRDPPQSDPQESNHVPEVLRPAHHMFRRTRPHPPNSRTPPFPRLGNGALPCYCSSRGSETRNSQAICLTHAGTGDPGVSRSSSGTSDTSCMPSVMTPAWRDNELRRDRAWYRTLSSGSM